MRRLLVPAVLLAVLLPMLGCGGTSSDRPTATGAAASPRALGGPTSGLSTPPPAGMMDAWETHIAARLERRLGDDGLSLEHLACPPWGHSASTVTCKAFVDGVVAEVAVELDRSGSGPVVFDAWLEGGVVATRNLVRRLEDDGHTSVDCGDRDAYPARIGLEIVCAVTGGDGRATQVVATVTTTDGSVEIAAR